jgi:hypothetical protein
MYRIDMFIRRVKFYVKGPSVRQVSVNRDDGTEVGKKLASLERLNNQRKKGRMVVERSGRVGI